MKLLLGAAILLLGCSQASAVPPVPPPPPVPLTDPAANARYDELGRRMEAAMMETSAALAEARQALGRIGGAPIGSPQWHEARAAALRLVELRRRDKAMFEEIRAFAREVQGRSTEADRARLQREIAWRSEFFSSTEANVSDVLARLVSRQ